jgi:hypothetical protein
LPKAEVSAVKLLSLRGAEKAINEVASVTERIDKRWPTVEASANKT